MKKTMLSIAIGLVASLLLFATGMMARAETQEGDWSVPASTNQPGAEVNEASVVLGVSNASLPLLEAFGVDIKDPKFTSVHEDITKRVTAFVNSKGYKDLKKKYKESTKDGKLSKKERRELTAAFILLAVAALVDAADNAETPQVRSALTAVKDFLGNALPEDVDVGDGTVSVAGSFRE